MDAPSLANRLLTNTMSGYRLALAHRRTLLPVLLWIFAVKLLGSFLLDLWLGNDQMVIINGGLVFEDEVGALPELKLALAVGFWLLALTAGTLALIGAVRQQVVDPPKAATLGRLFGAPGWEVTGGRVPRTAGAFLLGGVGLPLLAAYVVGQLPTAGVWPVLLNLVDALLLTGVVAGQAGILVAGQAAADVPAADARLAPLVGRSPRWMWLGLAMMAVPALLSAGVAAANPFGAASIRSTDAPLGAAVVWWPAGRHPIIVSETGVRFCDTDLCDQYVDRRDGPTFLTGGSTGIGRDGTVVIAATTGGKDTGGPFIEYGRCTRAGCQREWLPVRASSDEPFGWPQLAVASAPDGAVWFALAMLAPVDQPGKPPIYTTSLIRCARFPCVNPERHIIDTVDRMLSDGSEPSSRVRLSIGVDGRPAAEFSIGNVDHGVTCEPVSCANPQATDAIPPPPDAQQRVPIAVSSGSVGRELSVVSTDGRSLIVRDGHVFLVTNRR